MAIVSTGLIIIYNPFFILLSNKPNLIPSSIVGIFTIQTSVNYKGSKDNILTYMMMIQILIPNNSADFVTDVHQWDTPVSDKFK